MSVFIGYPSFMAYQMMKGKKGNNDGFPSIPGMIARYSALGLTNEQMAANPVWVDKTGNGHDLQMKNFAWEEGSGISDIYPGALVFDGVDDYGVCENFPILTKEKGYTVVALRRWLSFQDIGYPSLVVNSTERTSAFNFEDFKSKTKSTWNWGRNVEISDNEMPLLYTYQTSTSYNGRTIPTGATEEGSNIFITSVSFWSLLCKCCHLGNSYSRSRCHRRRIDQDQKLLRQNLSLALPRPGMGSGRQNQRGRRSCYYCQHYGLVF